MQRIRTVVRNEAIERAIIVARPLGSKGLQEFESPPLRQVPGIETIGIGRLKRAQKAQPKPGTAVPPGRLEIEHQPH